MIFFQLNDFILSLYRRDDLVKDAGISDAGAGFGGIALAYNTRSRADCLIGASQREVRER